MNNTKRIFSVAIALVLCLAFVFSLAACSPNTDIQPPEGPSNTTHTVTFVLNNGEADITQTVNDGEVAVQPTAPTKAGYVFAGWTIDGIAYDFSTPVTADLTLTAKWNAEVVTHTVTFVLDNGESNQTQPVNDGDLAVEPTEPVKNGYNFNGWTLDGVAYDFSTPVTGDITLTASWLEITPETARLTWTNADGVTYLFNGSKPNVVELGTTVTFSLKVSVYYTGTPVVTAGETVLTADLDGNYTLVVTQDTTITVEGVAFASESLLGSGTEEDPYLLSTPADFQLLANYVNSGATYGEDEDAYDSAYYVLTNDLDFAGEAVTPIGGDEYMFEGTFDGAGYTIKNFTFATDVLECYGLIGGMFGGVVQNLNVEVDMEFACDGVTYTDEDGREAVETTYFIGVIVGYNIGGDAINCTVKGNLAISSSLDTTGDNGSFIIVGGVMGVSQGYKTTHSGTTSFCNVDLALASTGSKDVKVMGGVVGLTLGTSTQGMAVVYNCTYNGTIGGKVRTSGGIVGEMRTFSSVSNCYATGAISAQNKSRSTGEVRYAIAGAIAGLAFNETVIANSASTATLQVTGGALPSATLIKGTLAGASYVEGYDENTVNALQCLLYNSVYGAGTVTVNDVEYNLASLADLVALLGWDTNEWTSEDGRVLAVENDNINFTVSFHFAEELSYTDDNGDKQTLTVDDVVLSGYLPMNWVYHADGAGSFVAENGAISYGFFFDEECTQRIPYPFFLTQAMDIYVGFANYEDAAGEYYVVIGATDVKITLTNDGSCIISYDAIELTYPYSYDGTTITIKGAEIANLMWVLSTPNPDYDWSSDFTAIWDEDLEKLVLQDAIYFNSQGPLASNGSSELYCIKDNGVLGIWYAPDGSKYAFYADGYCYVYVNGEFSEVFEYNISGSAMSMIYVDTKYNPTGVTKNATINEEKTEITIMGDTILSINRYDEFRGSWESDYATMQTIKVDGLAYSGAGGTVTYLGVEYPYSVVDGVMTFDGHTAHMEDGLLVLVDSLGNETVFGKEGSFIGTWEDTQNDYTIILVGITSDGYGYGIDNWLGETFTYAADWYLDENGDEYAVLTCYYGYQEYAHIQLTVDEDGNHLLVVSVTDRYLGPEYTTTYCDPFYGDWTSEEGVTLSFNGNGAYDIEYLDEVNGDWIVKGEVTISNGADEDIVVSYTYDRETQQATFTVDGVEYVAELVDGELHVTHDGTTDVYTAA